MSGVDTSPAALLALADRLPGQDWTAADLYQHSRKMREALRTVAAEKEAAQRERELQTLSRGRPTATNLEAISMGTGWPFGSIWEDGGRWHWQLHDSWSQAVESGIEPTKLEAIKSAQRQGATFARDGLK